MKTKIKILFLLFIVVIGVLIFLFVKKTLSGQLFSFGIKMDTSDLRLSDNYPEISGTNKINWVVADSKDVKLFLGQVNTQDPTKYINDKVFLLNSLYEPTKSPYPELITNTIDCPYEFKPVKEDIGGGLVYKLYAGERYGYGICTRDLVKYDSFYGLFDCGKKGVFEIKLFSSGGSGDIEKIVKSFSCKN